MSTVHSSSYNLFLCLSENGRKEASNYQGSPVEGTHDQPGVRKDKRKKQAAMRTEDDPQAGEGQGEGSACRVLKMSLSPHQP